MFEMSATQCIPDSVQQYDVYVFSGTLNPTQSISS